MYKIFLIVILLFIQSCTSIKSSKVTNISEMGLSYYMPMKDLIVTIKTKEIPVKDIEPKSAKNDNKNECVENIDNDNEKKIKKNIDEVVEVIDQCHKERDIIDDKYKNPKEGMVDSVTIGVTSAYPNMAQNYIMKHGLNMLGTNTMDVVITNTGLLTSAKSKTASTVNTALVNLASSFGMMSMNLKNTVIECPPNKEYSFIYKFSNINDGKYLICGLKVKIEKPDGYDNADNTQNSICQNVCTNQKNKKKCLEKCKVYKSIKRKSGIYYKQNLPYKVEVLDSENNTIYTSMVSSPSESIVKFMPITKTFFADNESTIGFDDGVITSFKMETKGELTAFFKLPADVIKAYFDAIGAILPIKKTNATTESELLKVNYLNELLKIKLERCSQAIKDDNKVLTAELGCFNLQ